MNWQCVRGDAENMFTGDCRSCIETGSLCDTSLACLNISRPHYVSQDYQMQLMLLEQHNKKRLLMARQEQDNVGQSSSQPSHHVATATVNYRSGNPTLQDYQMQMMLLEQQNKKQALQKRREMQIGTLHERNQQSLSKARQGPVDLEQISSSGLGQPALDNQAQLPVQKSTERPLEARNDRGAVMREVHPQPLMARDPFSPLLAPTAEASRHPDQRSQPATPSHGMSSAVPAVE